MPRIEAINPEEADAQAKKLLDGVEWKDSAWETIEGADALADAFCRALPKCNILRISAATHQGLKELITAMVKKLERLDESSDTRP